MGVAQDSQAQKETVQINGKVVDFFGRPWKEAIVELQSVELPSAKTKIEQKIKTNDQGEYSFVNLPEGSCEITIFGV